MDYCDECGAIAVGRCVGCAAITCQFHQFKQLWWLETNIDNKPMVFECSQSLTPGHRHNCWTCGAREPDRLAIVGHLAAVIESLPPEQPLRTLAAAVVFGEPDWMPTTDQLGVLAASHLKSLRDHGFSDPLGHRRHLPLLYARGNSYDGWSDVTLLDGQRIRFQNVAPTNQYSILLAIGSNILWSTHPGLQRWTHTGDWDLRRIQPDGVQARQAQGGPTVKHPS